MATLAGHCALGEHGDSQWWLQQSSLLRPGWWPVQKVASEWQVTTAVFLCPCPREGCAQGKKGQLEGPPEPGPFLGEGLSSPEVLKASLWLPGQHLGCFLKSLNLHRT